MIKQLVAHMQKLKQETIISARDQSDQPKPQVFSRGDTLGINSPAGEAKDQNLTASFTDQKDSSPELESQKLREAMTRI